MSEPRHEATPFRFRVIERSTASSEAPAWLRAVEEEIRPIDFGARRAGEPATAWMPRAAGQAKSTAASVDQPASATRAGSADHPDSITRTATGARTGPASHDESATRTSSGAQAESATQTASVDRMETLGHDGSERSMGSPVATASAPPAEPANSIVHDRSPGLSVAIEALTAARAELLAVAEGELVELSVEIARSLLGAEIEARPELHRTLVRAALDVLRGESVPRVRLSPEAFDAILGATGSRVLEAHGQRVELEADPELRGAGAVIEGGSSSVDARLETRLERVRDALLVARRAVPMGAAA